MNPAGTRIETDALGRMELPADVLYGIHTARSLENFPLSGRPVHRSLVHAYGAVKLACARTNQEVRGQDLCYQGHGGPEQGSRESRHWEEPVFRALEQACEEMARGDLDSHILVDALQGGAGTSTNMNVNEVLANRALVILGRRPGDYQVLSPLDDVNLHQSTNDTYPTALKIAAIRLLRELERSVVALQEAFQVKEKEFARIVKVGRTQMQDAVLVTLGREMGAYAEALGRDRWRVYKCEERLRVINLGGTAVGTGLGAPRRYIFRVTDVLREITGIGLARAENLVEATQNADVFVEVSGILKACAANLAKISGDLRLLSSGPGAGLGELRLPARQAGSSIMPGKVNPVIPEAATQAAWAVMANDSLIANACAAGSLELNPFLPVVADALLNSLDLLRNACDMLRSRCIEGLEADESACARGVDSSTAVVTALLPLLGYEKAAEVARMALAEGRSVREVVLEQGLVTEAQFAEWTSPEAVTRLGWPEDRP